MAEYLIIEGKIKYILLISSIKENIEKYSLLFKNNNVKYLINLCDLKYDLTPFISQKIIYKQINIETGSYPNSKQLEEWDQAIKSCIQEGGNIAFHCISNLGRSPTMLSLSLIIYEKKTPIEAIEIVRNIRPGSINSKQLRYIKSYTENKTCVIL